MRNLAIFGAGGFGREVLSLIKALNAVEEQYNIIGFFDDNREEGADCNGFKVVGGLAELNAYKGELDVVIAVGDPTAKQKIHTLITNKSISFPSVIHPSVIIADKPFVRIGTGCIICAGVMITTNIEIRDFVILNLGCTVGHDTVIGEYSSFMPSVNISGEVEIEPLVYGGDRGKNNQQIKYRKRYCCRRRSCCRKIFA